MLKVARQNQTRKGELSLKLENDLIVVGKYVAKGMDNLLVEDGRFLLHNNALWERRHGHHWSRRRKRRKDFKKPRKNPIKLVKRLSLKRLRITCKQKHASSLKKVRELAETGEDTAKVAFDGKPLRSFEDKFESSATEGFSDKQLKYIKFHTSKGHAKKLEVEEKQRDRGKRYCTPTAAQENAKKRKAAQAAKKSWQLALNSTSRLNPAQMSTFQRATQKQ